MGGPPNASQRERNDVTGWRQRTLIDAGVDAAVATRLATEPDVDLHALLELIDVGCPPHLAARILAPLDRTWSSAS